MSNGGHHREGWIIRRKLKGWNIQDIATALRTTWNWCGPLYVKAFTYVTLLAAVSFPAWLRYDAVRAILISFL